MFTQPFTRRRLTDEERSRQLAVLENRHGMSSAAFLKRYNAGELGDDLALIRWSGLLRLAARPHRPPSPAAGG